MDAMVAEAPIFSLINGINVIFMLRNTIHMRLLLQSSQHGDCWWSRANLAPGHLQPSQWRGPVGMYTSGMNKQRGNIRFAIMLDTTDEFRSCMYFIWNDL